MSSPVNGQIAFKGTKYERELNTLYDNDIINTMTTPFEAYTASPVFKLGGLEEQKFKHHYYQWRRKKAKEEEIRRTLGRSPPRDPLQGNAPGPPEDDDDDADNENTMATTGTNANNDNHTEFSVIKQNMTFGPPTIASTLKYDGGKSIIEMCIWLPSGVDGTGMELSVAQDNRHLNLCVPMDKYMGNGMAVHGDLVPRELSKKEKLDHIRVNHWNTLIRENHTSSGGLPSFNASVELPATVLRNTILRELIKQTPSGSRLLIVDLLVEEPKKPSSSTTRQTLVVNLEDAVDD